MGKNSTLLLFGFCLLIALVGADMAFAQRRRVPAKPRPQPTRSSRPAPQQPSAPPMPVLPDIRNDPDVQAGDITIIANITAAELRLDVVPNPTVEFKEKSTIQSIWHADRFNLPHKIEPGVTYRNIGIRLKIVSRLADIDRIVSEALGEIPPDQTNNSKDTGTTPPAGSKPQAPPSTSPSQPGRRSPK